MTKAYKMPPVVGITLGITFYELGNTFQYLIQPEFFPNFLRLVGFIIIIWNLRKSSIRRLEGGISSIFSFMLFWTVLMVLRGSLIGHFAPGSVTSITGVIQRAFLSPYGAVSYFIPFIAMIGISFNSLFYLKRIAIFLCVFALLMSFINREELAYGLVSQGLTTMTEMDDVELTVRHLISALYPGFGIILLFLFLFNYIKGWYSYLFPVAIFVFFLSMSIGGGRGQTGLNLIYLVLFFFILIKYPLKTSGRVSSRMVNGFSYILLGAAFVFFLSYLYSNTSVFDYVLERSFGTKSLGGDFLNDSRDVLRADMIKDFNNSPFDWIWGRGVNGVYHTQHSTTGNVRLWMEWGYLYLILKGGIVYLFLVAYCMIHATYLGFFKSNNVFSKCLAVMCLTYLLNLVSTVAEPQFSTQYLISWICFGLLERKQVRMVSDDDIYGFINNKNYIPQ